ncbi:MAG: ribonuclease P protein component [Flavobacterium sp.]|nr:MAG: ribonuclease P protein component [Flavobacterium sp.]
MRFKYPKQEKLKSRKIIAALFSEGRSANKFPVRLVYLPLEDLTLNQAAFSVPKRRFRLAVDRNRIKRLMREAYRKHKGSLNSNKGRNFALMFLYIGQDDGDFGEIEKAIAALLKKLPGTD